MLFFYFVIRYGVKTLRHLRARGTLETIGEGWSWLSTRTLLLLLTLPPMAAKVEPQMAEARRDIEKKLVPSGPQVNRYLSLPSEGQTRDWILSEMDKMDSYCHDFDDRGHKLHDWKDGKISGAVYHGGQDLTNLIVSAYERYCVSNPLHPDIFPTVRKMEAEVVSMCLRMFNNPTGAGTMTSGGTESIIMAVKAYRDWAHDTKGITEPEMIVPASAHAAFDKGAAYLKIKVHTIPVHPVTRQVDLARVKRAINPNTIMLVGSAPNFPDGNVDDITGLGKLAKKHNVGLHVDCCLGSFVVPFIERSFPPGTDGYTMPDFDFRVGGVTSISCDTHKYGFAPKGTSVIMYRTPELRRYQYYINSTWQGTRVCAGGVYASPSLSGSRPGALIAGAWAAMQYMGENGYHQSAKNIIIATRKIAHGIKTEIPELYILGNPPVSVVAFGAKKGSGINILKVGDTMGKKGWHLNALQKPAAVHIAVTTLTVSVVDTFIADLKDSIEEVRASKSGEDGTMVALYGLGESSAVGPNLVGELAASFVDALYKA
ncbi:pyridoxal phosphate-dependent transferase [Thelephora terrestris]|uniref:sphinganine-1-phosphate aldolase n=1 Tax=Thelephora terrestris TaxID=56493 RepID=A0A9P6H8I0_9AGAM|nr:pyridoxal phosphate-dependent transferase [Thelephora terrestris]